MSLLKVSDNYSANIVGNFTTSDATITVDVAPVKTAGYLTVFDLNGNQFEKIKYTGVSGLNLTGCVRGLSFDNNSDTPVSGNAKELKNGMVIKMTVSQHYINPIYDVINGDTASAGVMKNPAARVISDSRHLVDKEYADAISSAGIMAMLVTDAGGITIDINSGTYILNGAIKTYAGVAGEELTDDATNYVQIKDGALDIPTDDFDDDAIPLATVICAGADITSLVDNRPFYTGIDERTDSAAYLTGGALATSVVATWTAVNDGSFRVTVDGTSYNVDGIDFSSGVASMADVATKIQVALRAATSGNETVVWSTDKFIITSGTTGSTSEISVLTTSTGTVGTDISGVGATAFMDAETGRGTATIGSYSGIGRDANGIYIDLSANSGLEVVNGKLKVKTGTGIVLDASGINVDVGTTDGKIVQMTTGDKLPAVDGSQLTNLPPQSNFQILGKLTQGGISMSSVTITADTSDDSIYLAYNAPNTTYNSLAIFRLEKDLITGNYKKTHSFASAISGSNYWGTPSMTVMGNYLYYSRSNSDNIYRVDKANLSNETTITYSGGSPDSSVKYLFNDGTNIYVYNRTGSYYIKKYSVSGSTFTFVSQITSSSLGGSTGGTWTDATNFYAAQQEGTIYIINRTTGAVSNTQAIPPKIGILANANYTQQRVGSRVLSISANNTANSDTYSIVYLDWFSSTDF